MRRLLWLGVGIGIGVVVVRTLTKKAKAYTPAGLAHNAQESAGHFAATVRNFIDDVRDGAADREYEIRSAFAEGQALDSTSLPWATGVGEKFYQFNPQEGELR
jgi:hypothetical protein